MLNIKRLCTVTAAISTLVFSSIASSTTTLRVGTWLSPTDKQNTQVWGTWSKWVEDATEGRVKVKLEYGLGHPKTMFQLVEDGIVDASFSFHGYVPGRFKLPQIVEQPGLGVGAEAASVALWRVYESYFKQANEFEGLELLGLFSHGPGTIQSNFPIQSVADLKGKKIRIGGGVQTELAQRLDVTMVAAPATKAYEMLQQGVIDGIFMPLAQQKSLRLNEVTKYISIFPKGMYMGSFSMFINPEFMESLSEEDRNAIRGVSGEKLSALAGKAWEEGDAEGLEIANNAGVMINQVANNPAFSIEFNQLVAGMDKEWIDSVKDRNINAEAALKSLRQIASDYEAN